MVMSVRQTDNDSFWVNLWKKIRARFCKKKIKISINAGYLLFYLFYFFFYFFFLISHDYSNISNIHA